MTDSFPKSTRYPSIRMLFIMNLPQFSLLQMRCCSNLVRLFDVCLIVVVAACEVSNWSLVGKTAVVTGGTKGIGSAVVEQLLSLKAKVITCCRNKENLDNCLKHWRQNGFDDIHGCVADVSTPEGRDALVQFISSKCDGKIDCLINNVGTSIRKKTIDYTEEEYDTIMQTNLKSCFLLTTALYPLLLKATNGASIVNIASVAGGASVSIRSGIIYAMSKAAMSQMSYNLACEWAKVSNMRENTYTAYIAKRNFHVG